MTDDFVGQVDQALADIQGYATEYAGRVSKIDTDPHLTPEGKEAQKATLSQWLEEQITGRRNPIQQGLDTELAGLDRSEADLRSKANIEPRSADEWTTANARAMFIQEDAQRMAEENPLGLASKYREMIAAGDLVGAYLLARYGREALKEDRGKGRGELEKAINEATEARVNAQALKKLTDRRSQVEAARSKIFGIRTPAELESLRQRFKLSGSQ